jgi:aminoglycoside 3-N-acetyltransferase
LSESDSIQRSGDQPVTVPMLVNDLHRLGLRPDMTLLVHSSLSRLGWVSGGAQAVIQALQTAISPEGTLIMPTHSGDLSDPAAWQNPPVPESWWDTIRETMPAYDPNLTPTRGMGVIPEAFRKQSGVVRSIHPSLSFAAIGHHTATITTDHPIAFGLGEDSPLARIYDLDGWVLLLGVGHANNTSMHLAEYRATYPGKHVIQQGAPMIIDGERQWVQFENINLNEDDFPAIGAAFENTGQVRHGKVGYGEALLMPQRPLVDFAVEWMNMNRR